MNSRGKFWCFTSFDIENEPLSAFTDSYDYLVYGLETCPDTGRQHFQAFVAFKIRTKFTTVRNRLPGCHVEKMRGTPEEAADYCKKDGNYKEFGVLPTITKSSDVFKRCIDLSERGDLESIKMEYPGYYIRYKSTLQTMLKFDITELNQSCGVWISGPPRCGKDFAVRNLKSVFVKSINKWWDGYRNEENVLISDVEPDHCKWLSYFLKIWSDRYPFTAEVKGGSMVIRPKMIFVTSNFTIRQAIPENICDAIEARFTSYQFDNVSGYEVQKRIENPASDRVLRVLQLYEPDVFKDVQLLEEASPSTLSLEEAAFGTPEVPEGSEDKENTSPEVENE